MSAHPDDDFVFRYLTGEASPQDREHLRTCAQCHRECELYESTLLAFRGSVREWSESEFVEMPERLPVVSHSIPGGTWIMALLLLLALAGWKTALDDNSSVEPAAADRDAALLNRVNNDVERPVPSGLEPLLTLAGEQSR